MLNTIIDTAALSLVANAVFVLVIMAGKCWIDGAPDSTVCREWWR